MKSYLLYLILSSSFANQSLLENFRYADKSNCSEKRLDTPPGVMSKVPIHDQNDLLTCWSYASATLIDAWRIKNDPPVNDFTSPLDLGLKYATKINKPNLIEQDSAINVLRNANKLQTCTYKEVGDYMSDQKNYDVIVELANNYVQSRKHGASLDTVTTNINKCLLRAGISQKISSTNLQEYLKSQSSISFLNSLFSDVCKNKSINLNKTPQPTVVTIRQFNNLSKGIEAVRNTIDQKLNEKNPGPVGISFCWAALKTKDVLAIGNNGMLDQSKCKVGSEEKSTHFASVVGRRITILKDESGKVMKDNQGNEITMCQYLVRDSYGTSCNNFPDEPRLSPKNRCEQGTGQIWVDEDTLFTNTSEAFYLKDN